MKNKELENVLLFENSTFSTMSYFQKIISQCSKNCRRRIKNGPDYDFQVKCCTSNCKINTYKNFIRLLQSRKNQSSRQEIINNKIQYFTNQLQKEKQKYLKYREELKKRQLTIPVDLSLKPSPERWKQN